VKKFELLSKTSTGTVEKLPKLYKAALPDNILTNANEILSAQFIEPYGPPGNALQNLFIKVAGLLKFQGVSQTNIKAGLIIFSVLCSAKAGIPLSIVIRVSEDKAVAEHLLNSCLKLVPQTLYIEIHNQKIDDLFSAEDNYRNKILIGRDLKSLKKTELHLTNLLVNGSISLQESVKTKYGNSLVSFQVKGPVGFIGIENETEPFFFNNPEIVRISVSESDSSIYGEDSSSINIQGSDFEMDKVAEYINNICCTPVSFVQKENLRSFILNQCPKNNFHKLKFVFKILDVLTIINNPQPFDPVRLMTKLIPSNPENFEVWLSEKGIWKKNENIVDENLKVGKIEYFIMTVILDQMLPLNYPITSLLRKEIFRTIRDINFEKIKNSFATSESILRKLYNLAKTDNFWAKIDEIYLKFNKNQIQIISEKNIKKEIKELIKLGLIECKKAKNDGINGYYITTNEIEQGVRFPSIKELFYEIEEEELLEVIDPVTEKTILI
jgi:hypothetical protein